MDLQPARVLEELTLILARPAALSIDAVLGKSAGRGLDPCAASVTRGVLLPGAKKMVRFLLGEGATRAEARALVVKYRAQDVDTCLELVRTKWRGILEKVQIRTPDRKFDILANGWLLYQTLSCRMWARAAFYQAGGAYGFRDQLQDAMALAIARPDLLRAQLLRAAGRQFSRGDVQHWWHPPSGVASVRTSRTILFGCLTRASLSRRDRRHGHLVRAGAISRGAVARPRGKRMRILRRRSPRRGARSTIMRRGPGCQLEGARHGLPLMGTAIGTTE